MCPSKWLWFVQEDNFTEISLFYQECIHTPCRGVSFAKMPQRWHTSTDRGWVSFTNMPERGVAFLGNIEQCRLLSDLQIVFSRLDLEELVYCVGSSRRGRRMTRGQWGTQAISFGFCAVLTWLCSGFSHPRLQPGVPVARTLQGRELALVPSATLSKVAC